MTQIDLWTLREIEKDFLDVKPDVTPMDCINACRRSAKEWHDKIWESVQNDKSLDIAPFWIKDKEVLGVNWKGHYLSIATWIEHFFNLERQ